MTPEQAYNATKDSFPFDGYMDKGEDAYHTISRLVLKYLNPGSKILDFGSSQIFANKSTYTCIVFIEKQKSNDVKYQKITATDFLNNIPEEIKGLNKIILNLEGLNYASSTGIGTFTSLLVTCKKMGIELELTNLASKIYDVINVLGFTSFFKIKREL